MLLVFGLALNLAGALPAAAQIPVTPEDSAGWLIGPATAGPIPLSEFVQGPETPPLGSGSLAVRIDEANSKLGLGRNDRNGDDIDLLTALSYDVYLSPTATNANPFYVNLYIDTTGAGNSHDLRLDFAPPTSVVGWQSFDARTAPFWLADGMGPAQSLDDQLTSFPDARLAPAPFNVTDFPAIILNMGDTASSYIGFDGAIDNVVIADDVYDFELSLIEPVVAIPTLGEAGAVALALLLALGAVAFLRRRH
ncbi:MAG: hypothetical protein AAGD01_19620 [Acidobacteriota bacterium]